MLTVEGNIFRNNFNFALFLAQNCCMTLKDVEYTARNIQTAIVVLFCHLKSYDSQLRPQIHESNL